jgi:hypothetical protein
MYNKGEAISVTAVEVNMVVRRRGHHIFQTIGSQTAVRLSALRSDRPLSPGRNSFLLEAEPTLGP